MLEKTKPPSNLIPCRNAHLQYLCERMRPDEIEQYIALTQHDTFNPDLVALTFMNMPGLKFTLIDDDCLPVCAGGYHEVLPGIWQSWMVGTMDGWEKHWRSITKGSRWLMDGLFQMGARRLQTTALASRAHALQWYERSLGMQREGVMRGYGRNGEDVVMYGRVRPAESNVVPIKEAA